MVQGITGICKSLCRYLCNRSLVGGGGRQNLFLTKSSAEDIWPLGNELEGQFTFGRVAGDFIIFGHSRPFPKLQHSFQQLYSTLQKEKKMLAYLGEHQSKREKLFSF